MATDGLFDQPFSDQERLGKRLAGAYRQRLAAGRNLHGAVLEVLGRV